MGIIQNEDVLIKIKGGQISLCIVNFAMIAKFRYDSEIRYHSEKYRHSEN